MEINKQLFEDILSGKLIGTFILKNGKKISSERLSRNVNNQQIKTYPYNLLRRVPYLTGRSIRRSNIEEGSVYDSYTDTGEFNICFKSELDIMNFEPEMNMERINNEYYVSFEIAKLLKELGFDWDTYNGYNKDGMFADKSRSMLTWNHFSDYYAAPTLEVAQRWLRDVKNIDVVVSRAMQWRQFYYTIEHEENRTSKIDFISINKDLWWFKYEEALEAGINKALELILEKENNIMETINHEVYVSLEVAKLLKELGFDWNTEFGQHIWDRCKCLENNRNFNSEKYLVSLPTLEVAQRWLREVKGLHINVDTWPGALWRWVVWKINPERRMVASKHSSYKTYEEALESGIYKALEILLEEGE